MIFNINVPDENVIFILGVILGFIYGVVFCFFSTLFDIIIMVITFIFHREDRDELLTFIKGYNKWSKK